MALKGSFASKPRNCPLFCSVDDIIVGRKMRISTNTKGSSGTWSINLLTLGDTLMDAAMERRVTVATGWASTRIAVLDSEERYEDSYAITQEFREWIVCMGEDQTMLDASTQAVPRNPTKRNRILGGGETAYDQPTES